MYPFNVWRMRIVRVSRVSLMFLRKCALGFCSHNDSLCTNASAAPAYSQKERPQWRLWFYCWFCCVAANSPSIAKHHALHDIFCVNVAPAKLEMWYRRTRETHAAHKPNQRLLKKVKVWSTYASVIVACHSWRRDVSQPHIIKCIIFAKGKNGLKQTQYSHSIPWTSMRSPSIHFVSF